MLTHMDRYSLKRFLKSPVPIASLPYILLSLGGLGFLDTLYLTIEHYRSVIPPCTLHGCDVVLTSQYANLYGIPLAVIGIGFYVIVMVLTMIFLQTKNKTISSLIFGLCLAGFIVGIYLVYLQAFVIHAFCQYCLLSEVVDFLLFDASWWLMNSQPN